MYLYFIPCHSKYLNFFFLKTIIIIIINRQRPQFLCTDISLEKCLISSDIPIVWQFYWLNPLMTKPLYLVCMTKISIKKRKDHRKKFL